MNTPTISRRDFVKTTAGASNLRALGGLTPASAIGANDRIHFGVIGCGGMGTGHLTSFVERGEADNLKVLAVSDVYQRRLTRAKGICQGEDYLDYRKHLQRIKFNGPYAEEFKAKNDGKEELRIPVLPRRDLEGNFIDVLRGNGTLHCNAELGAATMVTIKMAVESHRQNKTFLWDAQKEKVVVG